jgi:predicted O-methyltransferase YrrM
LICSIKNVSYLEIGTWQGSSSISALYGNTVNATFIDNWSEFNGDKNTLIQSLEKYKGNSTYTLIESDCWNVDVASLPQYDVYLYDGAHTYDDHYKAIVKYWPCLKNKAIIMVDDWNWTDSVKAGTMDAFRDIGATILFSEEITLRPDETEYMPYHKGRHTWWNGIGIFVISK